MTFRPGSVKASQEAPADAWRWRYEAQTDVPSGTDVTVTATDRPGNTGALSWR